MTTTDTNDLSKSHTSGNIPYTCINTTTCLHINRTWSIA